MAERAEHERRHRGWVDAVIEMFERDAEVGGGIMAGALAYRLFIWMLPLALVAIAGLGYASDAAAVEPQDAAKSLGLTGIVSSSVAHSAKSSSRAYALLVGIPILLIATRSLLRALIVAHRLVWTDLRTAAPKPTLASTLQLVVALAAFMAITSSTTAVRHSSLLAGTIALVVLVVPFSAVWLLFSTRLPHRDAPWQSLVPGAIVLGVGLEAVQIASTVFISPSAASKAGTYGSLGVAAALLLGLFFISRVVVGTAVINATLWDRHQRGEGAS